MRSRPFLPPLRFPVARQQVAALVPAILLLLVASLVTLIAYPTLVAGPAYAVTSAAKGSGTTDEWPMYRHDLARTGASLDTTITTNNAGQLHQVWSYQTSGGPNAGISAGATVVNGVLYIGAWDGYEYAINVANGALIWKTKLGQNNAPLCWPNPLGVMSTASFVNGELYTAAGDGNFYALNATTGAIDWKLLLADTSATGGYAIYGSPVINNAIAYLGLASDCDNPSVQGKVVRIDLTTKTVTHTYLTVPNGQTGGPIWGSPALDVNAGLVYVATGNGSATNPHLGDSEAILALNASNLTYAGSWQIPTTDFNAVDEDFGSTPVLFTTAGGMNMVAAAAKNGIFYGLNRANLSATPVWKDPIAKGGPSPETGDGSISSASFANGTVYISGGNTTINGNGALGSVRAIDPATGTYLWEHAAPGHILGATSNVNGMVVDGAGATLEVLNASTGQLLYSYATAPTNQIYAEPTIAEGMIFFSTSDGVIHALSTAGSATACPTGWNCADIGGPGLAGAETVNPTINAWTINSSGADIWGTADQFHYDWQTFPGDGAASARVTTQANTDPYAKAGVMFRQSTAANAPFYDAIIAPSNGIMIQYRTVAGGAAQEAVKTGGTAPRYLRVTRTGGTNFSAYTSNDGTTWTLVNGSAVTIGGLAGTVLGGIAVTAHNNAVLGMASFTSVTLTGATIPPSPCPTGWNCADIGGPANAGSAALTNGTWTVQGGGADIWNTSDQFQYIWQNVAGNGPISAQVQSQANTDPYAKAGVMYRQSTAPTTAFYAAFITPANGILIQYRTTAGAQAQEAVKIAGAVPAYLQIVRNGTSFTTATSPDGITWTTLAGSAVTIGALNGTLLGGIAVTAHNNTTSSTVTFGAVTIGTTLTPTPTPTGTPLPTPTPTGTPTTCAANWTCADIGGPGLAGSASLNTTTKVWTIVGGGADIWGTADQFQFASQTLAGDGTLAAHVATQTNTAPYAKAGVMFRQGNAANAPYFFAAISPVNGVLIQYRLANGAQAQEILKIPGTAPTYLRLNRAGTTYSVSTSLDGTTWTLVNGSTVNVPNMTGSLLAGLAVTAHNTALLSRVTFDAVNLTPSTPTPTPTGTPPPANCAANWTCADIGGPTIAGSTAFNGTSGGWTIGGSGADIWGTSDQFRYAYQAMTADSTLSAHVTGQTNTNPYAKTGGMFRQSNAANAPFYAAFITPGNGILIQYRTTTGAQAQEALKIAGTVPISLRIQKQGNTFTAYTSTNGTTWTALPGSMVTITFTTPYLAGLAVTAHANTQSSTATIDNVSVTTP